MVLFLHTVEAAESRVRFCDPQHSLRTVRLTSGALLAVHRHQLTAQGRGLSGCSIPAQQRYPLLLLVEEQECYYDAQTDYYGNHNWDDGIQWGVTAWTRPVDISVIYLKVTHISREMDVIFTLGRPHGGLQVDLASMIFLLNGHIGWFWDIHFWTHGAAAPFHLDGLGAGQGRAADGGAQSLALQTVAVRAAIDVPALLVGIGLPAEVAHDLLWNCVFWTLWAAGVLSA